jgi:hypothetical protein
MAVGEGRELKSEGGAAMLKFMTREPLTGADFVIRSDGVCRLAPQLARRIAQVAAGALA